MFNGKEEAYFLTLEQERRAALTQDKQQKPEKQFNETTAVFLRRLGIEQKRR